MQRFPRIVILLTAASVVAMVMLVVVVIVQPLRQSVTLPTQVVQSPTATETVTPTLTLTPSVTWTHIPTVTPAPTATPIPTSTATPTATFTSSPIPPTETSSPTPTITVSPTRTPVPTASTKRCISVVGDSVAQGEAVFEIPGAGFARARMAPIGTFLAAQYHQRGNNDMQVLNRTASATSISSDKHTSYLNTVEYAQLLRDNCRYTLIVPWINDLTTGTDTTSSAANHVFALSNLAATLVRANPGGRILILTYYQGAPAPFALSTFASGFTPDRVNAYNAQIGAACASGALALRLVSCINIGPAFAGVPYLVGPTSRQEFEASLIAPLTPEEGGLINYFFGQNPAGLLVGDGVHLSGAGKAALAAFLVPQMP